jgi:hypothetical protein
VEADDVNQSVGTPNQSVDLLNPSAQHLNPSVGQPNQSVQHPNHSVQHPNPSVGRVNRSVQHPNKPAQHSNSSVGPLNRAVRERPQLVTGRHRTFLRGSWLSHVALASIRFVTRRAERMNPSGHEPRKRLQAKGGIPMAFPRTDTQLVAYSTTWNDRLTASAPTYGLTAADAASYTAVHNPYIASVLALQAAREAGIRSSPLAAVRNAARQALLDLGRELYNNVQGNTSVTDAAKIELGVVVIDRQPTPAPIPSREPIVNVLGVNGRDINLSVQGGASERARLKGTIAAQVFYFPGESPPAELDGWRFLGNVGRANVTFSIPADVAPGTKVWLTSFWINSRKESGPLSEPISTYIGGGVSQAA